MPILSIESVITAALNMKFCFFEPSHKVHKQRNVMRKTDESVVKYSRFNVLFNLVIFSLVLSLTNFYSQSQHLFYLLTVGLLITTLLRCYMLFRFSTLYPRAPGRWRNLFFWSTILGAMWWGVILASLLVVDGLSAPIALLWLYTLGVFSSCAHVYSPYQKFYSTYMIVCIVPSVVVSLFSVDLLTISYGVVLGIFLFFLQRQGQRLGQDYWDRLQLSYELNIRTNALEAEKMTSQNTSENKNTLVNNITQELKASLREIIGSLTLLKSSQLSEQDLTLVSLAENKSQQQMNMLKNTQELAKISGKNILLDQEVIDLRGCFEKSVADVSDYIYQKQLELYIQFSPTFPLRARADFSRIQQMTTNVLNVAANYANRGGILIKVSDQDQVDNNLSQFSVEVILDEPNRTAEIEQELYDSFEPHYAKDLVKSLNLAIARGLANCMGGDAGVRYTPEGALKFWFTFYVEIVTPQADNQNSQKLSGNRVLLFQPPEIIQEEYIQALESWGMRVDIARTTEDALSALREAKEQDCAFTMMLVCTRVNDLSGLLFAKELADQAKRLGLFIPQVLCLTKEQEKLAAVDALTKEYSEISILQKPVGYKNLRNRFRELLIGDLDHAEKDTKDFLQGRKVLLYQHEEINITIAKVILKQLGCEVVIERDPESVLNLLAQEKFDALLTETSIENVEISGFVKQAKHSNQVLHKSGYVLPIIGLNSHEKEGDTEKAHCLQNGINYYVEMPIKVEDLAAILRRFIGRAEHMAENARQKAS